MRPETTRPVVGGAAWRAGRTTPAGVRSSSSTRERSEPLFHLPKILQGLPGTAHGDPFPLPVFEDLTAGDRRGMPRYRVQRESRRLKRASLLTEAATALNALASARAGAPLVSERLPAANPLATTSATQRSIFNRLGRRLAACGPPPSDLSGDEALMELLHTKDMYELGESTVREELDLSRLRIVNKSAQPKPAENLVPPHILPLLLEPDRFIVRSDEELASLAEGPPIRPYWDPSLVRSPAKMRQFLRAIHEVGLLGFRRHAKAFASAFFIRKKDGNQRMIMH